MPRKYVVTGSASGIGAATTRLLESLGNRVIGVDVKNADVVVDLASSDGRGRLAEAVGQCCANEIDGVIACAGTAAPVPETVRINYFGVVATLTELRPFLLHSPAPRVVVIGSLAGIRTTDADVVQACLDDDEDAAVAAVERNPESAYPSSKAAIATWVRRVCIQSEWAGAGIPINVVAPAVVETPLTRPYLDDPKVRKILLGRTPMPLGGVAQPEQVASLLAWLASAENSRVTGQVIFIDGGAEASIRGDSTW